MFCALAWAIVLAVISSIATRVLIEGVSKKSADFLYGRNDQNTVVVFPKENFQKGEYVNVLVDKCTLATLIGKAVQ